MNKTATNSEADDANSGYQSTDFQTAYEVQTNLNQIAHCDLVVKQQPRIKPFSAVSSRRGSFSITTASECQQDDVVTDTEASQPAMLENPITDSNQSSPEVKDGPAPLQLNTNAVPFFIPKKVENSSKKEENVKQAPSSGGLASLMNTDLDSLTLNN